VRFFLDFFFDFVNFLILEEGEGPKPALIFAHGGGYVSGSVDLYSRFLTWLAKKTKCVIIAPHYRQSCKISYQTVSGKLKNIRNLFEKN